MKKIEMKDKRITLRISEDDLKKIELKAAISGISVSEYIRTAALRCEKGKTPKGSYVCPDCLAVYPSYFPYCGNCGHFLGEKK